MHFLYKQRHTISSALLIAKSMRLLSNRATWLWPTICSDISLTGGLTIPAAHFSSSAQVASSVVPWARCCASRFHLKTQWVGAPCPWHKCILLPLNFRPATPLCLSWNTTASCTVWPCMPVATQYRVQRAWWRPTDENGVQDSRAFWRRLDVSVLIHSLNGRSHIDRVYSALEKRHRDDCIIYTERK